MVDYDNLQESAGIWVAGIVLVIITAINLATMIKSLMNLKYKQAQLMLISIYLMPIVMGWIAWVQMMKSKELRIVWFLLTLIKSVCLTSFMLYIERMIGRTIVNGKSIYTKEKLYSNLVTNRSPRCILKCIRIKPIDSEDKAKAYIEKIRIYVYQLSVVFTLCTILAIIYALAKKDPRLKEDKGSKLFLILSAVASLSSIVALCGLLNFGMYANSLPILRNLQVMHKFIIIKLGLLFTEFQPLIIAILVYSGAIANTDKYSHEEINIYTNSCLMVYEMIILSFLIIEVYPLSDYDLNDEERENLPEENKENECVSNYVIECT